MENSDQDAARPPSGTLKVESGGINPALRADGFEDALARTGLTRADVGRLLKLAPSTVYRWGRHTATPTAVIAFLRFYEVWNKEDDLIQKAIELLEGSGSRDQLYRLVKSMANLRKKAEEFLSEK